MVAIVVGALVVDGGIVDSVGEVIIVVVVVVFVTVGSSSLHLGASFAHISSGTWFALPQVGPASA